MLEIPENKYSILTDSWKLSLHELQIEELTIRTE